VNVILEDLTSLPPKRLERRLESLAAEALPCLSATVFSGTSDDGLTIGLSVDPRGRRDVRDLARVLESEPHGYVFTAWASLSPNRRHRHWRLLLRVQFERPVRCDFVVGLDIGDSPGDPLRAALPLVLAAERFALSFDAPDDTAYPVIWVPAPPARECVLDVLAAVGV
jgi:hypothetical protein